MTVRSTTIPPRNRVRVDRVRVPWLLYVDGTVLSVRGATPQDLPGVALMHGRCSPKSLLDRYRTGGRAPAIIILDRHVRDPLSFVVTSDDGRIVGMSRVAPDDTHTIGSGEASMIIEDSWQRLGIGRSLLRHTAAAAAMSGYRQLITYPGTTAGVVQRLMMGIGTTRSMTEGQRHLHTSLSDSVRLGLGTLGSLGASPPVGAVGTQDTSALG